MPEPSTATVGYGASSHESAPSAAQPSMPSAMPETTVQPAMVSSRAKWRATSRPYGVQRRAPTMATGRRMSACMRPR